MKITTEYNDSSVELIEITAAKYIGDYAIRIYFSDATNHLVDFKPFLETSLHPSIKKYLEESNFRNYQIIDGNLNWNDYDMIFPIEDLYKGKI